MNLYLHVPFCATRCSYCDFYTRTNLRLMERYHAALLKELELRAPEAADETVEHIYLGGGTPSLLSIKQLEAIFEAIRRHYDLLPGGEITLEANPDDISPAYAEALGRLPINRVSMGVQSFDEGELRLLGRRHSRAQALRAVELLRSVGLDNLSLDLIYGLPAQTLEGWRSSLMQMLEIAPPHLSAYHLIYEEGTPMMRALRQGRVQEVSEEASLSFFELLIDETSRAGYEHYEISNFARPGCYARLNTGYWLGSKYIGLGPSAHSYDGLRRSHNVASTTLYALALEEGRRAHEVETLTPEDKLHEYLLTRLRTMWGIDLEVMAEQFSAKEVESLLDRSKGHLEQGTLTLEGGRLRLSLSGVFVSDGVIADLF